MQAVLFIFLSRKSRDEDLNHISRVLGYLTRCNQTPNLLLFPEGTDLSQENLDRAKVRLIIFCDIGLNCLIFLKDCCFVWSLKFVLFDLWFWYRSLLKRRGFPSTPKCFILKWRGSLIVYLAWGRTLIVFMTLLLLTKFWFFYIF